MMSETRRAARRRRSRERLYRKVKRLGLAPKHVAEVGVWYPERSSVLNFITDGVLTDLVEPDPLCVARIRERFGATPNVRIFECAVYSENTTVTLYRTNESTFVKGLSAAPALVNDAYVPSGDDSFQAEGRVFGEIDDGTIDLLSIDTEGCEWYVLQGLLSRPLVISVETHRKRYRNPYLPQIMGWMRKHEYRVWYRTKSDTVFVPRKMFGPFVRFR